MLCMNKVRDVFTLWRITPCYSQLKHSEIKELNEFCISYLKRLDPSNIVIVGDPIHCSTKESIEFAQHAKDVGADLIY